MRAAMITVLFLLFSSVALAGNANGPEAFIDKHGRLDLNALRDSGYEGVLETDGRVLVVDPETGRPSLLSSTEKTLSDEPWAEGFHLPGFNNTVNAVCLFGGGLYVGGMFDTFGNVDAKNMAYYDGERWWGFEERFGYAMGYVYCMAVHDGQLVIGGDVRAGNSANILGFDGLSVHEFGYGLSSKPRTLLVLDGNLIAGGDFYYDGNNVTTLKRIARWDGTSWLPFGTGTNAYVEALCEFEGDLIIGGHFSTADDVGVNGVARWNGSTFEPISNYHKSEYGDVMTLLSHGGFLYAGGEFDYIENKQIGKLARWDGTTWSQVGGGISSSSYCYVQSLHAMNGDVLVGGKFQQAGNVATTGAVIWNGTDFVEMSGGVDNGSDGGVLDALEWDGVWWLGGYFQTAGGEPANRIAVWDGAGWSLAPGTEGAGLNSTVNSLCIWNGDLIAGGRFTSAGTISADRLARWDGNGWHVIGGGLDNDVTALAVWNGDLIVSGNFLNAGGLPHRHIARWDGAVWHDLAGGLDEAVDVMTVYQDLLYVGGNLSEAGGAAVSNIARWDGTGWSDPGGGVDDQVRTMLRVEDQLLVGGNFQTAGDSPASHLASWDGSTWSEFGGGADGDVYALAYYGGVVAGGHFQDLGGIPCSRIGRWNGVSWDQLGLGFALEECYLCGPDEVCCDPYYVTDMTVSEGRLFVNGISRTGSLKLNYLACWTDIEHWTPLGSGLPYVRTMFPGEGKLWLGGGFSSLVGAPAACLVSWDIDRIPVDGDERWWSGFDELGVNSSLYSFGNFNGELVAAGWFTEAGGGEVGRVASWNGSSWTAMGEGFGVFEVTKPYIFKLLEWNGTLYASGIFSLPPATDNVSFARWNGSDWEPLMEALFPEKVYDLVPYGNDLLLIGSFTEVEGVSAGGLARYDGTTITPIPVSVTGDDWGGYMSGGVVYDGNFLVYGRFGAIDGIPFDNIARWDGASWLPDDDGFGVNGYVRNVLVDGGDLYVSGKISAAGDLPANGIAKWDGTGWDDLDGGLTLISGYDPEIDVLEILEDGSVVAAGYFNMASGTSCSERIAAWDGSAWNSLGSGFVLNYSPKLYDLAVWDGDLYVGGQFGVVGDKSSNNIARWLIPSASGEQTPSPVPGAVLHMAYPNPFNAGTTIRFELDQNVHVNLAVYDIRGRRVRTLVEAPLQAAAHEIHWDGRNHCGADMPSGVYLLRMQAGEVTAVRKVLYVR